MCGGAEARLISSLLPEALNGYCELWLGEPIQCAGVVYGAALHAPLFNGPLETDPSGWTRMTMLTRQPW